MENCWEEYGKRPAIGGSETVDKSPPKARRHMDTPTSGLKAFTNKGTVEQDRKMLKRAILEVVNTHPTQDPNIVGDLRAEPDLVALSTPPGVNSYGVYWHYKNPGKNALVYMIDTGCDKRHPVGV